MSGLLVDWTRLEGLELPRTYRSRRVSRLLDIEPNTTVTLCDVRGAGCLHHLWFTLGQNNFRGLIVRMYWDGETDPSVEAPLTDLCGIGHNQRSAEIATPLMAVAPHNGLNLYFPMPFARRAKITLTNDNPAPVDGGLYFQADYVEFPHAQTASMRFHAQWRRDNPAVRRGKLYTIAEVLGRGYLVGTTYHLRLRDHADTWFHGGGDQVLVDGGTPQANVLHGIGGEDFFGASWGIREFQTPYCGCLLTGERLSMYRFFAEAPIRFDHSLLFGFGTMANSVSSVAYWYQVEPHERFWELPPRELRLPEADIAASEYDVELEPRQQGSWAVVGPFSGDLETVLPPERAYLSDPERPLRDQVYPTNYGRPFGTTTDPASATVRWEWVRTALWWLDLNAIFAPKMAGPTTVQMVHGVAYLLARVHSPDERLAGLLATFHDGLKAWVNGREVYAGQHAATYAAEVIPLELRRGDNAVLLKVTNTDPTAWTGWCLSLRLCHPDGTPATDVHYDPLDDLPDSPIGLRLPPADAPRP